MKTKSFAMWFAALSPLTLLLAMMTYGGWREYVAWSEVKPLIVAELKLANGVAAVPWQVQSREPAEDHELRTASEDIEAISHVLVGRAHSQQLIFDNAMPQSSSRTARMAKQLLADAEPMFVKLESLLKSDEGSRYSGRWSGTVDLLKMSFHHACHTKDTVQALRALTLLSKTLGSDDTNYPDASSQQWQLRRRYELYRLIALSLEQVDWNQSQLDQLSNEILRPLDISRRLKASRDHDPQTTRLSILRAYDWQPTGVDVADE
ncbi:MAG: hypothetical protein ACO1RT_05625, partial [Planctomycetaceae bacterium]